MASQWSLLNQESGVVSNCYYEIVDGPAEDLYGIFINRVRRERPPEFVDRVRG